MSDIHILIGKAMAEIGAIEKKDKNPKQGWVYRGIDSIYNSVNPVFAKYGLFILPEVLEQRREERTNTNGTALIYTILTMRYTICAPDGSSVSCVVIGEAMDAGDKSANKAMSSALKYCLFQLLMIPTEEIKDPDADAHEIVPKDKQKTTLKKPEQEVIKTKKKVTVDQLITLEFDIKHTEEETGIKDLRQKICERVGVVDIDDMDEEQYKRALSSLKSTREAKTKETKK